MSNEVVTWLKSELAKFEGSTAVKTVETDVEAAGTSAVSYIKTNLLTELYTLGKSLLLGAATGTSWATLAATLLAQGEAAGLTIAKGAETIVLAQAQADLIAAGSLAAPSTGAVVASA
jgi:hypothetical protein